jgi:hypothetical protein
MSNDFIKLGARLLRGYGVESSSIRETCLRVDLTYDARPVDELDRGRLESWGWRTVPGAKAWQWPL